MTVPYKIRVKLGANEFDAEGPEDVVKDQFQLFLEAVKQPVLAPPPPPSLAGHVNGGSNGSESEIDPAVLRRVFQVENEQVTLRVLPKSNDREADGILLLLYGYRVLAEQSDVLASRLLPAAQKSGLNVERIDRSIAPYTDLVNKGGIKAGSRWGLRNTGVTKAEEIIRTLMT